MSSKIPADPVERAMGSDGGNGFSADSKPEEADRQQRFDAMSAPSYAGTAHPPGG